VRGWRQIGESVSPICDFEMVREMVWSRNGMDLNASGTKFRESVTLEFLPSDVSSLMFLV
jgi:hypothetical protein